MTALTATLYLDRSVLTEVVSDSNDPKRAVVSGTAAGVGGGVGKTDQITQAGSFRQYGNGNTRLILGSGQERTQTFALRAIPASDVETIKALLGHTVCYRDTYGRKVFGAFLGIQITALAFSGLYEDGSLLHDVAMVVQSVTYDEGQ